MHARRLIELAALVSVHGPVVIRGSNPICRTGLQEYWIASKSRQDRWGRALKRLSGRPISPTSSSSGSQSSPLCSVLEEILTGEVLTRVWTAVLCAYDRHRGTELAEPIARSVLLGHLEARHRVLMHLIYGPGMGAEQAVKLNRLRRRAERWTDVLVGSLAGLGDVAEFAVNPGRARDFADDLSYQGDRKGERFTWPIILASLRASFATGLNSVSPNADLNARIAAGILSCFRPELLDSTDLFRSVWLVLLATVANDAQGMIEEPLALDKAPSPGCRVGSKR